MKISVKDCEKFKTAKEMFILTKENRLNNNMRREEAKKIINEYVFPKIKEAALSGKYDVTIILTKQEDKNTIIQILKEAGYEITEKLDDILICQSEILVSWYNA